MLDPVDEGCRGQREAHGEALPPHRVTSSRTEQRPVPYGPPCSSGRANDRSEALQNCCLFCREPMHRREVSPMNQRIRERRPVELGPWNFAPRSFADLRLAPRRSASRRSACERLAPSRLVFRRSTPERSQEENQRKRRSAPAALCFLSKFVSTPRETWPARGLSAHATSPSEVPAPTESWRGRLIGRLADPRLRVPASLKPPHRARGAPAPGRAPGRSKRRSEPPLAWRQRTVPPPTRTQGSGRR